MRSIFGLNTITDEAKKVIKKQTENGVAGYAGTYVDPDLVRSAEALLGAKGVKKTVEVESTLSIIPTSLVKLTAADKEKNTFVIKVNGADSSQKYDVQFVKAFKESGVYKPELDANKKQQVLSASDNLFFSVANNVAMPDKTAVVKGISPVEGQFAVTVKADDAADAMTVLPQVVLNGKVVITGGAIDVTPGEGINGVTFGGAVDDKTEAKITGKVTRVNKEDKSFVVDKKVYYYGNAGSTFYDGAAKPGSVWQINLAEFESRLSVGDWVGSPAYYQKATGLATTFSFQNKSPSVLEYDSPRSTRQEFSLTLGLKDLTLPSSLTADQKKNLKVEVIRTKPLSEEDKVGFSHEDDLEKFDGTKFIPAKTTDNAKNTLPTPDQMKEVNGSLIKVGQLPVDFDAKGRMSVTVKGLETEKLYGIAARWILDGEPSDWAVAPNYSVEKVGGTGADKDDPKYPDLTKTTGTPSQIKIVKITRSAKKVEDVDVLNSDKADREPAGKTDAIVLQLDKKLPKADNGALLDTGVELFVEGKGHIDLISEAIILAKHVPTATGVDAPYVALEADDTESDLLFVTFTTPFADASPDFNYTVQLKGGILKENAANTAGNAATSGTFTYR